MGKRRAGAIGRVQHQLPDGTLVTAESQEEVEAAIMRNNEK